MGGGKIPFFNRRAFILSQCFRFLRKGNINFEDIAYLCPVFNPK